MLHAVGCASWAKLMRSCGYIGRRWGCMGPFGYHLGPCWGHVGATLGGLEGYLGPPGGLGFRV